MSTNNALNVQGPTPAFRVTLSADQLNTTGNDTVYTVPFDTVSYDLTSSFNTTTHEFTAPLAGIYFFDFCVQIGNFDAAHTAGYGYFMVNSNTYWVWGGNPYGSMTSTGTINCPFLIYLSASDTIKPQINIEGGTKVITVLSDVLNTSFSGTYIPTV